MCLVIVSRNMTTLDIVKKMCTLEISYYGSIMTVSLDKLSAVWEKEPLAGEGYRQAASSWAEN